MTLASASLLVSSCGGSDKGGCTLTGHTSFTEYTTACVTDLERNRLDSQSLTDGNFSFHVADSVAQPYALILMLDEGNSDYAIQVMITSARAGLLNSVMYTVANAYLQFNHSLPS